MSSCTICGSDRCGAAPLEKPVVGEWDVRRPDGVHIGPLPMVAVYKDNHYALTEPVQLPPTEGSIEPPADVQAPLDPKVTPS